ncbi:MAG: GH25 family lysozyme, partial [Chitinophagaceae bacterium]
MRKSLIHVVPAIILIAVLSCITGCKDRRAGNTPATPSGDSSSAQAATHYPSPADSGANAYGIDISKYQGNIVSDIISKDALSFVICKATEGETYTDPDFSTNWQAIKAKNLIRGAYHFYHTDDDPVVQARFFIQTLQAGGMSNTDLPPILDIETGSLGGTINTTDIQNNALTFLTQVEQLSQRTPILYSSLYFANKYLDNPAFARYPLWIAEYSGGITPLLPQAWQQKGYIIWQRNSTYTIDSDTTDYDVFNGTRGALYRFVE